MACVRRAYPRLGQCAGMSPTCPYPLHVDDDWRLMGQEGYLQGAVFVRKPYKEWSASWEHDHCDFCQSKFVQAPELRI